MTRLLDRIVAPRRASARSSFPLMTSFDDWLGIFSYDGLAYNLTGRSTLMNTREEFGSDYSGFAQAAYKANGIVFACMAVRMLIFSEARFQFQELPHGRLFGDPRLDLLERPWPNGTTRELLARMEMDNSLAGNGYYALGRGAKRGQVVRLRPDWVTIFLGSEDDPDVAAWDVSAELLGYGYHAGGPGSGIPPVFYEPDEVAHYTVMPDPDAIYRGMSWLTPIVREIQGDKIATEHKLAYFENGGTPNVIVSIDVKDQQIYDAWVQAYRERWESDPSERFKTMILGAGAKAEVVGSNLRDIEFKATQGAGETRIAAAAGVPPAILGISEGLQGSALNTGNYSAARRRLADGTIRPLWGFAAGALETLVPPPHRRSRLWVDENGVAFLREDEKDTAEIVSTNATAIRTLVDGGFTPQSAVEAVESGDLTRLVHSGKTSVQLYPGGEAPAAPTDQNGTPTDDAQDRAIAAIEAGERGST